MDAGTRAQEKRRADRRAREDAKARRGSHPTEGARVRHNMATERDQPHPVETLIAGSENISGYIPTIPEEISFSSCRFFFNGAWISGRQFLQCINI